MSKFKKQLDCYLCAIYGIAQDTGYDENFLIESFYELLDDGETPDKALEYISGVSYEKDW